MAASFKIRNGKSQCECQVLMNVDIAIESQQSNGKSTQQPKIDAMISIQEIFGENRRRRRTSERKIKSNMWIYVYEWSTKG